jgi:hypothetical protein
MPSKQAQTEKTAHIHRWTNDHQDLSYRLCACGSILISYEEKERRIKEWENYDELSMTTGAYRDYLEMRGIVKVWDKNYPDEDLKARKDAIDARIMERNNLVENEWGDMVLEPKDPMPKPHFPDPRTWKKYEVVQ